jgi:SOS-response transcriptional repressor LexA
MSNVNFETLGIIRKEIRYHIANTLDEKLLLQYENTDQLPIVFNLETVKVQGKDYPVSAAEISEQLEVLIKRKLITRVENDENVISLTSEGIKYARAQKGESSFIFLD